MDLLTQIRSLLPDLTLGEKLAAEFILEYPFDVIRFPAATIADSANTSRSNVVRFCQKLGFSGYSEFKYALDRSLKDTKHVPARSEAAAGTVLQKYLSEFAKLETLYHSTQLREVAETITSARRILVLGQDHSFYPAQQLAFRLNRAGVPATATNMSSTMEAYYGMIDDRDVIIIFSVQAMKLSYEHILTLYREKGPKIILITMAKKPAIAGYAHQVISLPSAVRTYSSDMLDEAPTFYLFIELLMEAIHALPLSNSPEAGSEE